MRNASTLWKPVLQEDDCVNTLEKVLVNRAQNGTYHKEELIEITKKLWITGDISETVKDQVLEIIKGREDCEPPVTTETRLEDVESTLGVLLGTGEAADSGERAKQTRLLMMNTARSLDVYKRQGTG